MISFDIMQGKPKENFELVSLIRETNNERTEIKVICPISTIKEIKDTNKETLIKKIKEKPSFEQDNPSYLFFIQNVLDKEFFYLSPKKFDYGDYKINNEKPKNLNWDYNNLEVLSQDNPCDEHVLDNQDIGYILKATKFEQIKGNPQGDNIIPDTVSAKKWEEFCCVKRLNFALMVLMYDLQSSS